MNNLTRKFLTLVGAVVVAGWIKETAPAVIDTFLDRANGGPDETKDSQK